MPHFVFFLFFLGGALWKVAQEIFYYYHYYWKEFKDLPKLNTWTATGKTNLQSGALLCEWLCSMERKMWYYWPPFFSCFFFFFAFNYHELSWLMFFFVCLGKRRFGKPIITGSKRKEGSDESMIIKRLWVILFIN